MAVLRDGGFHPKTVASTEDPHRKRETRLRDGDGVEGMRDAMRASGARNLLWHVCGPYSHSRPPPGRRHWTAETNRRPTCYYHGPTTRWLGSAQFPVDESSSPVRELSTPAPLASYRYPPSDERRSGAVRAPVDPGELREDPTNPAEPAFPDAYPWGRARRSGFDEVCESHAREWQSVDWNGKF